MSQQSSQHSDTFSTSAESTIVASRRLGRKKASKNGNKQNAVDVVGTTDPVESPQELQKRNVVQEDPDSVMERQLLFGPASQDGARAGSDSEEDNEAAGRSLAIAAGKSPRPTPKPLSYIASKKKNKSTTDANGPCLPSSTQAVQPPSLLNNTGTVSAPAAGPTPNYRAPATPNIGCNGVHPAISAQSHTSQSTSPFAGGDGSFLTHDNIGRIIIKLLPSEYQVEALPDGRYAFTPAAVGYLAQKLGNQ